LLAPRAQSGGRSPVLDVRRREFITLLGGAAAGWPIVVDAQQSAQMRRIGALMNRAADNPQGQIHLAVFREAGIKLSE
jgi:putative tryptophan/tyrosine transport system substrate-binding protein